MPCICLTRQPSVLWTMLPARENDHVVMSLFLMLYRRRRSVKFLTIIQAGKVIRHKSVWTCAVKKTVHWFCGLLTHGNIILAGFLSILFLEHP